ncbi:MAG TPA: DMT family transporter [Roseomonas sp.]
MRGPAWLLTAIGLWSVLDANSKLLSGAYGVGQVLVIRHAVLLLLVLAIRALRPGAGGPVTTAHPVLHAIRAMAMLGSAAGFFLAMRQMSMAEAYLVHFTAPFMMLGLAALLLGEAMPARAWGWTAAGFAGVAMAIAPSVSAGGHWQGYACAGFGAACYAVIMTVNRRLRTEQGLAAVILWPSLLGVLAALPFAAADWVPPGPRDLALLALNGAVSGVAMLAMSLAFRHANAARLAIFEYTALLFALGFDLALWGRLPALATLAGAAIVVAACIASERARSAGATRAAAATP